MIRCVAGCTRRTLVGFNNYLFFSSSSTPSPALLSGESPDKIAINSRSEDLGVKPQNTEEPENRDQNTSLREPRRGSKLVSTVFASLKTSSEISEMEKKIADADTINEILSLSQKPHFSRQHALQVVSVLADWASTKKIKITDFESDPRFVQICTFLSTKENSTDDSGSLGDLATVLGVTGDDQAAKLISSVTLTQKIQVMTALSRKQRRSMVLLRALSFNIGKTEELLDVKQAADVLYAMAMLNFPDNVLLKKASADLCLHLPNNKKPAVVGSILTSLGLLRYKNDVLVDALAEWIENCHFVCRVMDLVAFFLTMASINYHPPNAGKLYQVILPAVIREDITRPTIRLDVVWSLVVLGLARHEDVQSVLSSSFINELSDYNNQKCIPSPSHMKLLNINAAAKILMEGYRGPFLPETAVNFSLKRSKQKLLLVQSVLSSLSNLFPSSTYLRPEVDTGHGFFIDGECVVDNKCNPLPLEDTASQPKSKRIRVAVLVCDYPDMCCGRIEIAGHVSLHKQILEKLGYSVMIVPYTEFNPSEKLVSRVKYLEQRLKDLARTAS